MDDTKRVARLQPRLIRNPLFGYRLFVTSAANLAQRRDLCSGDALFWHERQQLKVDVASDLVLLDPAQEAAVLHLTRGHGPDVAAVKAPLWAAGDALVKALCAVKNAVDAFTMQEDDLVGFAPYDVLEYDSLEQLLDRFDEDRFAAFKDDLTAAWNAAIEKAKHMTEVENRIFDLG